MFIFEAKSNRLIIATKFCEPFKYYILLQYIQHRIGTFFKIQIISFPRGVPKLQTSKRLEIVRAHLGCRDTGTKAAANATAVEIVES
jgi:hypothetical protein